MRKEKRKIVSFFELSPVWQQEAIENLGECAEEAYYLEPFAGTSPKEKYLTDLTECIRVDNPEDANGANGVISISNICAMMLRIDENFESADVWYI